MLYICVCVCILTPQFLPMQGLLHYHHYSCEIFAENLAPDATFKIFRLQFFWTWVVRFQKKILLPNFVTPKNYNLVQIQFTQLFTYHYPFNEIDKQKQSTQECHSIPANMRHLSHVEAGAMRIDGTSLLGPVNDWDPVSRLQEGGEVVQGDVGSKADARAHVRKKFV